MIRFALGVLFSALFIASLAAPSVSIAALPAGRLVVERAYRNDNGDMIVSFAMDPAFDTPLGINTHFWGDSKRLQQLHETISAPLSESVDVTQFTDPRLPRGKEARLTSNAKKMRIFCDSVKTDFAAVSDNEKEEIQKQIRKGKTRLVGLRDARFPLFLFKVRDTHEFIYVDQSTLNPDFGSMRVFIGEPRKMKRQRVVKSDRVAGGSSIYYKLQGGALIYLPDGERVENSPVLKRSDSDSSPDEPLVKIDAAGFDLTTLGIPAPVALSAMRTPCDLAFGVAGKNDEKIEIAQGARLKTVDDYIKKPPAPTHSAARSGKSKPSDKPKLSDKRQRK